jgi:protein SCO1/2
MSSFSRIALSIFVALSLFTAGCTGDVEDEAVDIFYGDDIIPHQPVQPFTLLDEAGNEFNITDYDGRVIVVAFLFTRCPDVCPVVSANLRYISLELADRYPDEVGILSITVDPWTDNSSVLADYRNEKNLTWPHLTGELALVEPVWRDFDVGLTTYDSDEDADGVVDGFDTCPDTPAGEVVDADGCGVDTQKGDNETVGRTAGRHHPLDYWVDHTTGTIIIDRNNQQRVWWADTEWNADMVLKDIEYLLAE